MADRSDSTIVRIELEDAADIEDLVIGYRKQGEFHEVAAVAPPAAAELQHLDGEPA